MEFEGIELIKDDLKVAWTFIGEGLKGEYNPRDKQDIPVMRLDVCSKVEGEWI